MIMASLINSNKTVFSLADLGKIAKITEKKYLKLLVFRLVFRGELKRICRGYYGLRDDYDPWELANKIFSPSYVSLETVLFKEGVIFQDYSNTISSVGTNKREKKIGGRIFLYYKIKNEILLNPLGVKHVANYIVAEKERAIGDMIYLHPNYHFDNLTGVDKKKLHKIADIYNNKRVYQEIKKLC